MEKLWKEERGNTEEQAIVSSLMSVLRRKWLLMAYKSTDTCIAAVCTAATW